MNKQAQAILGPAHLLAILLTEDKQRGSATAFVRNVHDEGTPISRCMLVSLSMITCVTGASSLQRHAANPVWHTCPSHVGTILITKCIHVMQGLCISNTVANFVPSVIWLLMHFFANLWMACRSV